MIARVFPRRTKATPDDDMVFIGYPTLCDFARAEGVDEVHVSVAFSWDMPDAEQIAAIWQGNGFRVKMGGPAFSEPGGEFVPGRYVKRGYVVTSRGCPNRCWFCAVPKREGYRLRELPITEGWNVLDDNLLACSDAHIKAVFDMLKRQSQKPEFTGGLEARLLKPWHADLLRECKAKRLYCAYDTPDDLEPLIEAGRTLRDAGITAESHTASCYVLIGYRGDTFDAAEKRLNQTIAAGFLPYAMLYRDEAGQVAREWRQFQREWCRPQIVATKLSRP